MPSIKKYHRTPLEFDAKLVERIMRRRTDGESLVVIATALKTTTGRVAMAELVGTTKRVTIDDDAKLARAIAKDRKAGKSWGWLAARYGVTEATCQRAYTAATGKPHGSLDHRRKTKAVVAAVLALLLLPAMASATPRLSVARGQLAVARSAAREQGTVATCRRVSPRAVACELSEDVTTGDYAGWNVTVTAIATLNAKHRCIRVSWLGWEDEHPYREAVA